MLELMMQFHIPWADVKLRGKRFLETQIDLFEEKLDQVCGFLVNLAQLCFMFFKSIYLKGLNRNK